MRTHEAIELIQAKARLTCPGWTIDDNNRQPVQKVAAWLARESRPDLDRNKGLLIIGNVGTGKSLLIRAVREAMRDVWGASFGMRGCADMSRDFNPKDSGGYQAIEPWINAPHVCFDDLGTEPRESIHMGLRTNLMAEVIEGRYDRLMRGQKAWTHFTTNLGLPEIEERYGPRAFSRLRHICNVVDLGTAADSVDRRASAAAIITPKEVDNPDNVYTVVHPSIAARLQEALAPTLAALKAETAGKMRVVESGSPSQSADLEKFRELCEVATEAQLMSEREALLLNNTPGAALPFVAIIDAELRRIHNAEPVTAPVKNPTERAA